MSAWHFRLEVILISEKLFTERNTNYIAVKK